MQALAEPPQVEPAALERWIAGEEFPPHDAFLQALDIVAAGPRLDPAGRPAAGRKQVHADRLQAAANRVRESAERLQTSGRARPGAGRADARTHRRAPDRGAVSSGQFRQVQPKDGAPASNKPGARREKRRRKVKLGPMRADRRRADAGARGAGADPQWWAISPTPSAHWRRSHDPPRCACRPFAASLCRLARAGAGLPEQADPADDRLYRGRLGRSRRAPARARARAAARPAAGVRIPPGQRRRRRDGGDRQGAGRRLHALLLRQRPAHRRAAPQQGRLQQHHLVHASRPRVRQRQPARGASLDADAHRRRM